MDHDIASLFAEREAERYALHTQHLNEQMVRVLKTIGYDVGFARGQGQYLYDRAGRALSRPASAASACSRSAATIRRVRDALKNVLDSELPNLVQMDVSALAGILAERLLALRAVPRQGLLRQFRRRSGRSRHQVRARGHRPRRASSIAAMPFTA